LVFIAVYIVRTYIMINMAVPLIKCSKNQQIISDSAFVVRGVKTSRSCRRKRVLYSCRFMGQREVYEWVTWIKEWLTSAADSGQTSIVTCFGVKGEDWSAYPGQQRKSIDQSA